MHNARGAVCLSVVCPVAGPAQEMNAKASRPSKHCPKSFWDITWNVWENEILYEIFRVVSCFPHYISCYIAENGIHLGQCIARAWHMCLWAYIGCIRHALRPPPFQNHWAQKAENFILRRYSTYMSSSNSVNPSSPLLELDWTPVRDILESCWRPFGVQPNAYTGVLLGSYQWLSPVLARLKSCLNYTWVLLECC